MLLTDWEHHPHRHHQDHQDHPAPSTAPVTDTMHVRKPSSSDSVSSLSSSSSSSRYSSPSPTRSQHRQHSRVIEFDPLCLNPTFQAPPRLNERPFFKQADLAAFEQPRPVRQQRQLPPATRGLSLPPVSSPASNPGRGEEAPDYFHLRLPLLRRPTLQRSHWSESTVHTVDLDHDEEDDDDETPEGEMMRGGSSAPELEPMTPTPNQLHFESGERLVRPVTAERWQNFSYKRNTVPRRPALTTADSVENYIKRGGWKRRGIVFQPGSQQGDGDETESTDRYSAHTVI